jgi:hypothetical protein
MFNIKPGAMRPSFPRHAILSASEFAAVHGAIETVERCRRCGAAGRAHYERDGWGFAPRGACGDPLKCGDKPNMNSGPLILIEGGRA